MSVVPIEKSKASTGSLNTSSTSLAISKESGVTLVHPDGKELPESFEYIKPEKSDTCMYITFRILLIWVHCVLYLLFSNETKIRHSAQLGKKYVD